LTEKTKTINITGMKIGTFFKEKGLIAAFILMCALFSFLSPVFLSVSNFLNIALQSAALIIMGIGMSLTIASGGIDLSVGAVIALTGIIMGLMLTAGFNLVVSILVGLLCGVLVGAINGFIISKFKVTPFIATLATYTMLRAIALIISDGRPIYGFPVDFRFLGSGKLFFNLPTAFFIALACIIIFYFVIEHTRIGRNALAIGGNKEAARLSGINLVINTITFYALAALLYSIAGIIYTARLNAAEPIAAMGVELEVIAATVLGGTRMEGGYTKISGTVTGALVLAVLRNGLTLLGVQSYYQQLTIGVVIVLAVLANQIRKK